MRGKRREGLLEKRNEELLICKGKKVRGRKKGK